VGSGARAVRVMRGCTVEVTAGPGRGTSARLDKTIFRVGSHASNDLVLPDETVSRHHLELRVEPEGWRIVDLGSSNGTLLGRARLGEVLVQAAATLTLGATTLAITPADGETELPGSRATRFGALGGQSPAMRELFAQLEAVAKSDVTVLLEGETGTGKERVAESIHRESARAGEPFVVVDCGALAGSLMESELFGHVRGAFTGAEQARTGLIEAASGGTLFLDEVGELPLALQAKLLGVLTRGKVTPVGAGEARKVDVRVIAATHRNLPRAVNAGLFRAELFYRLAVVRLRVPPLRERLEDVPLLVGELLTELRAREGERVPDELSAVALARLSAQPWPGNVRELRNTVEAAVINLPSAAGAAPPAPPVQPFFSSREVALAEFHRRYFARFVNDEQFNYSRLAAETGLDRGYLHRILKRYGINLPKKK
jgi:two-component system, NtrC family, response regulator GlrR